jgi:hypothetical protein
MNHSTYHNIKTVYLFEVGDTISSLTRHFAMLKLKDLGPVLSERGELELRERPQGPAQRFRDQRS